MGRISSRHTGAVTCTRHDDEIHPTLSHPAKPGRFRAVRAAEGMFPANGSECAATFLAAMIAERQMQADGLTEVWSDHVSRRVQLGSELIEQLALPVGTGSRRRDLTAQLLNARQLLRQLRDVDGRELPHQLLQIEREAGGLEPAVLDLNQLARGQANVQAGRTEHPRAERQRPGVGAGRHEIDLVQIGPGLADTDDVPRGVWKGTEPQLCEVAVPAWPVAHAAHRILDASIRREAAARRVEIALVERRVVAAYQRQWRITPGCIVSHHARGTPMIRLPLRRMLIECRESCSLHAGARRGKSTGPVERTVSLRYGCVT